MIIGFRLSPVLACAALLQFSASAWAAAPENAPYLDASHEPDTTVILPQPPAPGSLAQQRDADLFGRTRALQGTPRWNLATQDVDLHPDRLASDFSCATGVALNAQTAPALVHLLARMEQDARQVSSRAKDAFHTTRPQVGNTAPICEQRREELDRSPSYPSGHTTIGWAAALILAEIAPDHATPILTRGRIFGESRIVCGVHWASDVEGGRTNGAALAAALHADPSFQSDLAAARRELAALRERNTAPKPDAASCAAEANAASGPR